MTTLDPHIFDGLAEKLAESLLPTIKKTIQQEISSQVTHLFSQNTSDTQFFKPLTEELMCKISAIYQEVHTMQSKPVQGQNSHEQVEEAAGMVTDASQKLHQIMSQTEKATFDILDRVERSMEAVDKIKSTLDSHIPDETAKQEARNLAEIINEDLMAITTGMSFQDLTGQRIKRVIGMLQRVEDMTADLYVSTGIILKTKERSPDKNLQETKEEIHEAASQNDVDKLLEQLNASNTH